MEWRRMRRRWGRRMDTYAKMEGEADRGKDI